MDSFLDQLFEISFAAAYTAIFEVGSIMAVLMLVFGILDYRYGEKMRKLIVDKKLDRPILMTLLTLIPIDGTLLFEYSTYRRKSIRFGSLTAGIIGYGEEATYLVLSYNPMAFLAIAGCKIVCGVLAGNILNRVPRLQKAAAQLHTADEALSIDEDTLKADENFHELPDKFRHKLHLFRYHRMGRAFWLFFSICLMLHLVISVLEKWFNVPANLVDALGIPLINWIAMLGLFAVVFYRLIIRMTTREFGKIYEQEFEDQGDAVGDLAETCSNVIVLIFVMTFFIDMLVSIIGLERITTLLEGRAALSIVIGSLVGLIPGTGASLAFTTLYFTLAGSPGALPFAALLACSISLIGDSQFIGNQLIRRSQTVAHWIAFGVSLLAGFLVYAVSQIL